MSSSTTLVVGTRRACMKCSSSSFPSATMTGVRSARVVGRVSTRRAAAAAAVLAPTERAQQFVRPFAKKAPAAADNAGSGTKVNLYDALAEGPALEPTQKGEVPQWFLDTVEDWQNKTGEFAPLEELDSTAGKIFIRKTQKAAIKAKNLSSKKE